MSDSLERKPEPKKIPRTVTGLTFFILKEIFVQKRWLLLPIWVLLLSLALIIFLGGGSSILPAIYIAF